MKSRGITAEQRRALEVQHEAIAAWNVEIARRFSEDELALEICDVGLRG